MPTCGRRWQKFAYTEVYSAGPVMYMLHDELLADVAEASIRTLFELDTPITEGGGDEPEVRRLMLRIKDFNTAWWGRVRTPFEPYPCHLRVNAFVGASDPWTFTSTPSRTGPWQE